MSDSKLRTTQDTFVSTGVRDTAQKPRGAATLSPAQLDLLALQQTAGNRAVSGLLLNRRAELSEYLITLQNLPQGAAAGPRTTDGVIAILFQVLQGLDLSDPANLRPVAETIAEVFPPDVLTTFLAQVDATVSLRQGSGSTYQNPYEKRLGQVGRNPTTGAFGPGVLLPAAASAVRPLGYGIENAGEFIDGVIRGLGTVNRGHAELLSERLGQSVILGPVFGVPFLLGTGFGIGKDVWEGVLGAYELLVTWDEVIPVVKQVLRAVLTPEGRELAGVLGEEVGAGYAGDVLALLSDELNVFEFTFHLGALVGAAVLVTVLSLLGINLVTGAVLGTGLVLTRLFPHLRRLKWVARLIGQVDSRRKRARGSEQRGEGNAGERRELEEGSEAQASDRPAPRTPLVAAREELERARRRGGPIEVNIGGKGEYENAINLNPNSSSKEINPQWPNWVNASGEHIGDLFPPGRLDIVRSRNLHNDVDWQAISEGCMRALKPGGTVELHAIHYPEGLEDALRRVGFTNIRNDGGIIKAIKP